MRITPKTLQRIQLAQIAEKYTTGKARSASEIVEDAIVRYFDLLPVDLTMVVEKLLTTDDIQVKNQ